MSRGTALYRRRIIGQKLKIKRYCYCFPHSNEICALLSGPQEGLENLLPTVSNKENVVYIFINVI